MQELRHESLAGGRAGVLDWDGPTGRSNQAVTWGAHMPRPRFLRLDEERRERLLATAAEEFAAHGYDRASLNAVIERLRLSKGQFYYYFDGKADLFGAVLDWTWERVLPDDLADFSRLDASTFWPHFETLVERSRTVIRSIPWYIGLMRHLYYPPADEEAHALVAEKLQRGRQLQLTLVRRGQELGCVRNDLPEELVIAMLSALDTAADRWCVDHWDQLAPEERDTLTERLFEVFRNAFEPPVRRRNAARRSRVG